jgi:uncharacterized protein YbjT (DUF2867 family)
MTALVLGATGFVGRALVEALVESRQEVRAGSRHPLPDGGAIHGEGASDGGPAPRPSSRYARSGSDSHAYAKPVACDLRMPDTLPAALQGVDCVYYLVHSMGEGRPDFAAVERACAQNLARAAAASGCRRIVYLGGVAPVRCASEHLSSRLEVGEVLRAGSVETLELRAAMIVGDGSVSWKIVRDLALRLPIMVLPRWLASRSRPIALRDVVAALLDARHVPLEGSAWFDIPGPEVLSARQILQRVAMLRGRRITMLSVPLLTPRLSAMWLKLVTGADYGIARELVLGLAQDLLPRDARYWRLTGHQDLQPFDDAARQALAVEEGRRHLQSSKLRTRMRDAFVS